MRGSIESALRAGVTVLVRRDAAQTIRRGLIVYLLAFLIGVSIVILDHPAASYTDSLARLVSVVLGLGHRVVGAHGRVCGQQFRGAEVVLEIVDDSAAGGTVVVAVEPGGGAVAAEGVMAGEEDDGVVEDIRADGAG